MSLEVFLFLFSFATSGILLYILGSIWFSDTRNKQLMSFFVLGTVTCLWCIFNAITMVTNRQYFPIIYTLRMICLCIVPYAYFWYFMFFSFPKVLESRIVFFLMIALPALDILMFITNPLHHFYIVDYGHYPVPTPGSLFWIHSFFAYFVIFLALISFFRYIILNIRRHPLLLLAAVTMLVPFTLSILLTTGILPLPYDITPIGMCYALLLVFIVMFKSRLLNFKQALLTRIFESYKDIVLLVGEGGLILDANAALEENFPQFDFVPGTTSIRSFKAHLKTRSLRQKPENLFDLVQGTELVDGEFGLAGTDGAERTFELAHQLIDPANPVSGYSVSLSDISSWLSMVDEINQQNQRLLELKEAAEAANHTKSNFLANMSHEIRTPMNAIVGMSELLLRGELSDESRGYAIDIKQAGANLLSIINDLLDFSKIEAGKLEIVPTKYMLSSLVNDTVSIIRMRLMEKPVRFFTNIDSRLPNDLVGDEVRMRQILLNLLGNAVKYTDRGHISITIAGERREGDRIVLRIAVSDSGFGISEEDQRKLFGDFVQVDMKKNKGIEGTGLGLAITKRLCVAMGGDITVESEYGKGSTFTVTIPQVIGSDMPFASVEKTEEKKVLVYERRDAYARSVCWSLENLGIYHLLVADPADFDAALKKEDWDFVFSGYGLYEQIQPVLEKREKRPVLALMVEWGTEAFIPNVRFVSLPVQSLSIADILNGAQDRKGYYQGGGSFAGVRFAAPSARLLVVDDIATNLKVAEGLLSPYGTAVDTCLSGAEAVELVKHRDYDIVFMDHMMPEMDGIEATKLIRAWESERQDAGAGNSLPVIALTANAVSGMREMFLQQGFSDFLAKPIDISKLDEIMGKWIPREKREKAEMAKEAPKAEEPGEDMVIPGVNISHGIAMTGGTLSGYKQVLSMFRKDAAERLPLLQSPPDKTSLPSFITQVHALKSASGTLGAAALSSEAARLEAAGKEGNLDLIRDALPDFVKNLGSLAGDIRAALEKSAGDGGEGSSGEDMSSWLPLFRELAEVLRSEKVEAIDRILEELNGKSFGGEIQEVLDNISDEVLMTEFGKAGEIVRVLLEGRDPG